MSGIFTQANEDFLRKIIENDEAQTSKDGADRSLDAIIEPQKEKKKDIRELHGGKAVPPSYLSSRGFFYPEDLVIVVFPLKVSAIRHFSSIDENDGMDVDAKLRMIINEAVLVQSETNPEFDTDSLLEIDRLYLILIIRSMTFTEFPSIMNAECTCTSCGNKDQVDVRPERIGTMKKDALNDFFNNYSEEQRMIVRTISGKNVSLCLPSCYNMQQARKFLSKEESQDKFMACFVVKPWTKLSKKDFDSFEAKLDDWTPDIYVYVKSFVERINSSYSVDLYYKCSSCDAGVVAPLRFQRGIKELFIPNISD